jgi:hypothetical protein
METRTSLQNVSVETTGAQEAVLFANTPSYILARIRKDSSASYVASKLSTAQILQTLGEMVNCPIADVHELVQFYVFLVSLTMKNDVNKFARELKSLDLRSVQWGAEILDSILNEQTPTTVSTVTINSDSGFSTPNSTNTATGIVTVGG